VRKPFVVTTFGKFWGKIVDPLIKAKGWHHFNMSETLVLEGLEWMDLELRKRLTRPSDQASEIVFRIQEIVRASDHILMDGSFTDTAPGQLVLMTAASLQIPVHALSVKSDIGLLAPAYLSGVLYPVDAQDIIKLLETYWRARPYPTNPHTITEKEVLERAGNELIEAKMAEAVREITQTEDQRLAGLLLEASKKKKGKKSHGRKKA
jgi:hypothetical protein